MLVTKDQQLRKREVEFNEADLLRIVEDEVRAKLNLDKGARVKVEIDVSSSGLLRGATVEVTEGL